MRVTGIETLKALQSEVGSRRAGTDGERRAQQWLKARCEELGLPVELDEFAFIGSESYRPLLQMAMVIWAAISIWLSFAGQPFGGAIAFAGLFLYLSVVHKKLDVRLARTRSRNVIAGLRRPISDYVADPEKGPAFLICAHYDTPRSSPHWFRKVRDLMRFLGPLAMLGIMLHVAFMVLRGLAGVASNWGMGGPHELMLALSPWVGRAVLVMAAPLGGIMLFTGMYTLLGKKVDSPGADDNGSGTVLVLELARRIGEKPLHNAEVFFAWWGAEERGLFGSRQFVRRFHDRLSRDILYLVNADCVGVGESLTIHTGQGLIRRHATDAETVRRLERIARDQGAKTIRTWESIVSGGSSDHAEWVDRGYVHAVSLVRGDHHPSSIPGLVLAALLRVPDANSIRLDHIHSADDTIEGINPRILQESIDVAEAYVREIDEKLGSR